MPAASLIFTITFAALLIVGLVVRFYLASRQIRHVMRNRATVPTAFASTISLTSHQKAADYTVVKARFGLLEMAFSAAALLGWTLLGGIDALNQALTATSLAQYGALVPGLALLVAFGVISGVLDLPFTLYSTFRIEERFGFNKTTFKLWLGDLLKSTLVGIVIGLPVVALMLWLMRSAGGLWWLWAWGTWMGFNLLVLVLYPTVIAPLFNKFKPLDDENLKARVTALMTRCGFAAKGLFVMDGSKRSAHANAYFTGFGAAKRVVFYDTLLSQLNPGEVDAVLAHELGHFKHKHIIKRIVGMFAMSLVGFALLGWVSTQTWFYTGLGVRPQLAGGNEALALLLFMLVIPLFSFFITPLFAQVSRKHEFEADAYAVAQTEGRPRQRTAQASPGQCQHADTRPGFCEVLLFAPTRVGAVGPHDPRTESLDCMSSAVHHNRRALSATEIVTQLSQLNGEQALGWRLIDAALEKTFKFKNFYETMAFVNALAFIANAEDHHPDLAVSYGQCTVRFNTHDVNGISVSDFFCAAKVDGLLV